MAQVDRGDQTHRKDDTRVLIEFAGSPTVDLGNRLTNLSASASWAYETTNDRTELTTNREITVQFDADTGSTGGLVYLGETDASDYYGFIKIASNKLECEFSNGGGAITVFSVSLPNLGASLRTYTAQWCTRPNPLTTGASDSQLSELLVIDHDTADSYAVHRATHVDINPTISSTQTFSYGMVWTGGESSIYSDTIAWVRVGARFHSTTEAAGEWKETFSSSITGIERVQQVPMPTRAGIEDEFAGPQLLYADMAHVRNSVRLLSPLVNEIYASPVQLTDDITDDVTAALVITQDTTWQAHEGFLRYRPAGRLFNKLRVRVSGQLWNTVGAPDKMEVRVYSSAYPVGQPAPDPDKPYLTLTWTADDTSAGPPTWKSGLLRVVRDPDDFTYLWLAFRTNDGSASANNLFSVWGWTVDPVPVALADDEDMPPIILPP